MTDTLTPRSPRFGGRAQLAAAAAILLALGGGAGAVITAGTRPSVTMAPATPIAIRALADDSIATVRGRVAEVYGNKFVLADASGRALVDLGREGDGKALVSAGQPVTVQGRFDDGFIHASFLVGADNKVVALGPIGGGRHAGPDGPGGRGTDRGPDHGPDRGADHAPDRRAERGDARGGAALPAPFAPAGTPATPPAPSPAG